MDFKVKIVSYILHCSEGYDFIAIAIGSNKSFIFHFFKKAILKHSQI